MKMLTKIKNIAMVAVLAVTVVSCKDFLDTPPVELLSSDGFYQTPTQSEQGLIGIYAGLRDRANDTYLLMAESRSDKTWVTPMTNGLREYSEIGTFRAGYDIRTFNDAWNGWYQVIYNANIALARIPDCDFGDDNHIKEQFLGEAHFLRGWAYFELVRLFGNVPLIDRPLQPAEVKEVPQSNAKEILERIIVPDLLAAKAKLPIDAEMVNSINGSIRGSGRADKIAAQAMLGRVYMTMAGFPVNDASALSLAETELKAVIDFSESNANKYWAPDSTEWRKQFMPEEEYYNKYPIFSIQYRTGGTGNPAIFNFSPSLPPTYTTRRIFGNGIYVDKTLMYEFDKTYSDGSGTRRDARGHNYSILTGYAAEPNWPAYANAREPLELPDGTVVDVYVNTMIYKFLPTKRKIAALGMAIDAEGSMLNDEDWGVNLPIIRLEDVMLMYAEILATKDVNGAMTLVNKIRERAGCTPETAANSEEALAFVKRERSIELLGEGIRWFDIVRWNEWQTAVTDAFDRYNNPEGTNKNNVRTGRHLFPIPLNQMNIVSGFYTQNEGY